MSQDEEQEEECKECEERKERKEHKKTYSMFGSVERKMVLLGAVTAILLSAIEILLFYGFFRGVSNFSKYVPYLAYLIIATVFIGSAVWHIKHYRKSFNCSIGMMVGMTVGMMSGFMIGAILGATNGMFIGSVIGMLTGMFIGAWCARTCGVMSKLEGLMAGLMSGLMGAMTSVMMINDNIALFMPLLIGSCVLITGGMSYMVRKEIEEEHSNTSKYDMMNYVALMFIFAIAITFIIMWGPRSAIVI